MLTSQACYRTVTEDGLPLIGAVPGAPGAFVATGYGVWGILNAPTTGEALAELVLEGAAWTVNLAPFDPARLGPLIPVVMLPCASCRGERGAACRSALAARDGGSAPIPDVQVVELCSR